MICVRKEFDPTRRPADRARSRIFKQGSFMIQNLGIVIKPTFSSQAQSLLTRTQQQRHRPIIPVAQ